MIFAKILKSSHTLKLAGRNCTYNNVGVYACRYSFIAEKNLQKNK